EALLEVPGITIYGPPPDRRTGLVTFSLDDIHAHDLASLVDAEGVAIRAGHHCCMPLHERLGVPATARASFAVYNSPEDIEARVRAIHAARKVVRTRASRCTGSTACSTIRAPAITGTWMIPTSSTKTTTRSAATRSTSKSRSTRMIASRTSASRA